MKPKKYLSFTSLRETISNVFSKVKDWRQTSKVKITIHDAMLSGFACMYFQDESLLQFQKELEDANHKNNLRNLFGVEVIPKETQMRDIIDNVDSDYFAPIFKNIYQKLQRGKYLEQYQIFPAMYYFPIDGTQFFSSNEIHCSQCLTKKHSNGKTTYSHQVLQGGIMHPDCKEIIPFMPEQIVNTDGASKQDCEINAAKRFIPKLHKEFPQLGFLIGGDALFSKQPLIEDILFHKMHYLFVAKPDDHKYMMAHLSLFCTINKTKFRDEKNRLHRYEWCNNVSLNNNKNTVQVNFLRYTMIGKSKRGDEDVLYKNSWVTDLLITSLNVATLVKAGRCRWKTENECFNVLKNHGYHIEHNYGHGVNHLSFNCYLLSLLAFFLHQISELTDKLYQANRIRHGSKKHLWNMLRSYIRVMIFDTWETLLHFNLYPDDYQLPDIRSG